MHKHENCGSPRVNLRQTKETPSVFVSVFWALLTISCYCTTKTPVGLGGAWSPLAKCCTGNAADAIPCSQSFWFVGNTCVSAQLWIQQRAVISTLLPSPKLVCPLPALQINWWSQNSWREDQSLVQQWKVGGCTGLFLPLEDSYFHKYWAVVLWNR